ncbi:recombinase family protein [Rhodococcus sp. GA1]|uniref:recombinase family protein n=1 Tax=Rhodococcus sp. GA1 TaxID=2942275 RepID=UPI0034E95EFE
MGAAAQLERGLIVKRLKAGRRHKAESGGYAKGSPPYGQRAIDGELVEHPGRVCCPAANACLATEGAGVRTIARRLNDAGIPSKRGGRWHPSTGCAADGSKCASRLSSTLWGSTRSRSGARTLGSSEPGFWGDSPERTT